MNATILSFRRSRYKQKTNQFLLEVDGCDSRAKASAYIGKRIVWTSPVRAKDKKPKEIQGKITNVHGNNGVLRARFNKGLPGTALRSTVEILDKAG